MDCTEDNKEEKGELADKWRSMLICRKCLN